LKNALEGAEVARIEIEKASDNVRILIHSARPGAVIGKKGQEIDFLKNQLSKMLKKNNIEISVQEVKTPELNAMIVAKSIAEQLEKRGSYKKAMKKATLSAMKAGAKGIKICTAGRLNGAEIARTEWTRVGSIPLHTLRADIDYGFAEALTTYGLIGVKVWICKGEYQ
jgi:small subunit ribosomal protein S3